VAGRAAPLESTRFAVRRAESALAVGTVGGVGGWLAELTDVGARPAGCVTAGATGAAARGCPALGFDGFAPVAERGDGAAVTGGGRTATAAPPGTVAAVGGAVGDGGGDVALAESLVVAVPTESERTPRITAAIATPAARTPIHHRLWGPRAAWVATGLCGDGSSFGAGMGCAGAVFATAAVAADTWTTQTARLSRQRHAISARPGFTAVTNPSCETMATAGSLVSHVIEEAPVV
jgi:hypothetical protein